MGALMFIYLTVSGTLLAVAEYRTGPAIIGAGGPPAAGGAPGAGEEPGAGGPPGMGGGLTRLLTEIHGGGIGRKPGEWLVFATGVGCTVLSVTGIAMYLQLWGARRRRGKPAWFWG